MIWRGTGDFEHPDYYHDMSKDDMKCLNCEETEEKLHDCKYKFDEVVGILYGTLDYDLDYLQELIFDIIDNLDLEKPTESLILRGVTCKSVTTVYKI